MKVWRQIFKSVWKNHKTRYQSILDSLQRHSKLLAEQANLLHIGQSQFHIQTYENDLNEMFRRLDLQEDDELAKKQQSVLQWFSAASTTSTDHEDSRRVRETSAGNGSWILENEKANNWMELDPPDRSILWINGIPGAGKMNISISVNFSYLSFAETRSRQNNFSISHH